ncbi:MAG: YihY family inner membrane protein [Pseudomonadota bacterium]
MIRNWINRKNLADLQHLLCFIGRRFAQDRCAQMAASLTFTTLLSLVPLVTIALTLFSAFPVFDDFYTQIKEFLLTNMMPATGGRMISRYTEQFAESAAKLTAVGIAFLALTAMLMMLTIDHAFNTIWRVSRPRPLVQRVLIYWAVLTLAPLLVGGSLSLTSWLVGMSVGYAAQIPALGVVMLKIVPVILTTAAFSLLFRIVPNRFVPLRHAVIGGVAAALAFEFMNRIFAVYILHFPTYKLVYGTFASIPIFLLWVYLSWLTVLLGALITASLSHWRSGTPERLPPATEFYFALRILKMMSLGMRSGTVQTLPLLSRRLRIGFDALEQILEKLAQANVVRKLSGNAWVMVRDAQHIRLAELYRVLVFDPSQLAAYVEAPEMRARIEHIALAGIADAGTLHDLLQAPVEPSSVRS